MTLFLESRSVVFEIFRKGALFLIFLFLTLLVVEGFIRHFYPQQLILNLRIWEPEPLIGWRHKESLNTIVNMGEHPTHFVTDEQGRRINYSNKEKTSPEPPDLSILMIGDSFLEALGVENEEAVPERIREMLEQKYSLRVRTVNAGVGAWQPGQYLLEARRVLKEASYDFGVVFFYIENDCVDKIQLEFTAQQIAPATRLAFPPSLRWEDIKRSILYPVNNYLEQRSHFFVFLKDRLQILLARVGLTPYYFPDIFYLKEAGSRKWDVTAAMAHLIEQEFRQFNTPVLFVLLTADYHVYPKLISKYMKMFDLSPELIDLEQPN
ncbi:MAG: SGNH/GDSL hydrolase family protein, partial [Candidatus Omnitrophica bacterium]|nr:SGNH/GDSL hydrolase family protein [Candidatus Omnitrophota bacterium]